jgi:hypothetical protein
LACYPGIPTLPSPRYFPAKERDNNPTAMWQMQVCSNILRGSHAWLMSKTGCDMVVDQARGLHMRVHDRAADKLEAALFQVLT